jgi:hypothetical protein
MVSLSARRILRSRQRDAWDALADIEVFRRLRKINALNMDNCRSAVFRRRRRR